MDYIRCYRARFGVESICAVLQKHGYEIAPSTFYAYQARGFGPTDTELDDAYMANEIFDLWVKTGECMDAASSTRPRCGRG